MMNVTQARRCIAAIPYVAAKRTDGEWRIAPTLEVLLAIYPHRDRKWAKAKQERAAAYTEDNSDAHFTAAATHGWCVVQLQKTAAKEARK
jgi:hypothetical protein